ncbi:hypothetical protein GCM10009700_28200 [Brevibacterium sanguinis]
MPRVKRSLFLKSGVEKALRIAPIKRPPQGDGSQGRCHDLANETNTCKRLPGCGSQAETERAPLPRSRAGLGSHREEGLAEAAPGFSSGVPNARCRGTGMPKGAVTV